MGKAPDYKKYTIYQLYDVYNHIDREKYPDRFQKIVDELNKRKSEQPLPEDDNTDSKYDQLLRVKTKSHPLPILPIVQEAFNMAWKKRSVLLRALLVPFIISILLTFVHNHYSDSMGLKFDIPYRVVQGIVFTILAITCHRLVLLGDSSVPKFGIYAWSMRETRFFGWYLFVSILFDADIYLKEIVKKFVNDSHLWLPIIQAIVYPVGLYLFARLSVILPTIAIDKHYGMGFIWNLTNKNGFSLILITTIISSLIFLVAPIYFIAKQGFIFNFSVRFVAYLIIIVDIVALSLSYKFLSKA